MDYYTERMEQIHSWAIMLFLVLGMLAAAILIVPVQLIRWIGRHMLMILFAADFAMTVYVIWLMKATGWSFWRHW